MLTAIAAIGAIATLAAVFGLLLGYSAIRFHVEGDPIADQVDTLLPQSQCGQCGYPGCRPYADAVASGEAEINQCAPGGQAAMLGMAELLGREPVELGDAVEKPKSVAVIDEQLCIGCTKCLQCCPVDAIVGAAKQLHGIIASECTGCELCTEPCPVNCVRMVPIPQTIGTWKWPYPANQTFDYAIDSPESVEITHREAA
ncbi:MAG TPA: electron transport complex subunit RsxB [Chromatiaceae bacterium]|jgi:electron transport complex protein RnfB|nr:MAG: electron transport complex subunit RsxB [Thiohalocapsa sp. PB-PSB1]HBG95629.1 electron transport complex subunit RsxB [Chromatiaceae bacterium]HCS92732.1 electron transport complex subunit RsxB [Chromatiaceae bacterium]